MNRFPALPDQEESPLNGLGLDKLSKPVNTKKSNVKPSQYGQRLWQMARLNAFNSFAVREGDGLTIVDGNRGSAGKDLLKAAETVDLPITRITLTHTGVE